MPEQYFRYIPTDRLPAWEAVGWKAISPFLTFKHLAYVEGFAGRDLTHVIIVEFVGSGPPIEPDVPLDQHIKVT